MFCSNCGTQLPEGAAFCSNCGTALNAQQAPVYEQPQVAESQAPVYEQPQAAEPQAPVYEQPQAAEPQVPVYEQPQAAAPQAPTYEQPQYQTPTYEQPQYVQTPVYNAQPMGVCPTDTSILVKGIISAALLCTFYFSFVSIIFGVLATKSADQYMAFNGNYSVKARIGRILGKVGMITGIVFSGLVLIVIIAAIAGA